MAFKRNIELHWSEVFAAAAMGALRKVLAVREGKGNSKVDKPDKWWREVEGCCAEVAAARGLDRYWWFGGVGVDEADREERKRFDVSCWQVRNAPWNGHLIVRPEDKDTDIFILVEGESPRFRIVGWMRGHEAKQAKYEREDAWWVPQSDLHGLETMESTEDKEHT